MFSYYFDDGKIAYESVKITDTIKEQYDTWYKLSGNGYFRFVYQQKYYILQYYLNGKGLEGTLSKLYDLSNEQTK